MINNLAAYRKAAKLTQEEFADKIGIGTVTLSKWENPNFDLKTLSIKKLETICEILHVSIWNLIKLEKREEN